MSIKHPAKPLRLLTSVPNKVYDRLIVRYPFQTDRDYAASYHFSARDSLKPMQGNPLMT